MFIIPANLCLASHASIKCFLTRLFECCKFIRFLHSHPFLSFQDDRLLEYDIDKLVFEARSPYQKVQIVHSKSLGNLLVLDELQSKG